MKLIRCMKKPVAILLAVLVTFSAGLLFGATEPIVAAEKMNATLLSAFNLRSAPFVGDNVIVSLGAGTSIIIDDIVPGANTSGNVTGYGYIWYKVTASTGQNGYIIRKDVDLDFGGTDTFANQLGYFPESYRASLTALHEQHPAWVYVPLKTGYAWDAVLNSQEGKNAVWYSYPISQRSLSTTLVNGYGPSYNEMDDTFYYKDGSSFYFASRQTIAHYMDPRNFLNEVNLFMFESLGYSPSQTVEGIEAIVAGTFLSSAVTPEVVYTDTNGDLQHTGKTYADMILSAAEYSGASAYFLAARMRMELGVGIPTVSKSVSGTFVFTDPDGNQTDFTGYYNYYNIYASDSAIPDQNIANGLTYAKDGELNNPTNREKFVLPWTDPERSIMGGARYIAENYIRVGQDTLYLQKFSVNPATGKYCWHQYMSSVHAPKGESQNVYNSYAGMGILDNSMEFIIPVFDDMPASAVQAATETRSTNNLMTELKVDGENVDPAFSYNNVGPYELMVGGENATITISGRMASLTAELSINGTVYAPVDDDARTFSFDYPLVEGDNEIPIVIKAQNGGTRTYTLSVFRGTPPPLSRGDYTSTSDDFLIGFTPGTTVAEIADRVFAEGCETQVFNLSGTQLGPEDSIGTGCAIRVVMNGKVVYEETVVLFGDANGDGRISATDLSLGVRGILGLDTLSEVCFVAADANRDQRISATDLSLLKRHILSIDSIQQS